MKAVSIVIKIVLVLVVLVLGAGGVTYFLGSKPYSYSSEVAINAPPADVFEHLTRPELLEEWLSGVESLTPIDANGKPLVDAEGETVNVGAHSIGARAECVVNEGGNELTMITEVVQSKWARMLEVKITSPIFEATSRYIITPVRNEEDPLTDNSSVLHEMEVKYISGAQMVAPFVGGATQTKLDEDLAKLKEMSEDGEALQVAQDAPKRVPAIKEEPADDSAGGGGSAGGGAPPGPPPTKEELEKAANEKDDDDEDEDEDDAG